MDEKKIVESASLGAVVVELSKLTTTKSQRGQKTTTKTTALRKRMREDLRLRNYSHLTEKLYLIHFGRYAAYFNRSPMEFELDNARIYLWYLKEETKVSLAHVRQAVAALRFFCKYTVGKEWMKERIPHQKLKNIPVTH